MTLADEARKKDARQRKLRTLAETIISIDRTRFTGLPFGEERGLVIGLTIDQWSSLVILAHQGLR